jgi:hypothetical protein
MAVFLTVAAKHCRKAEHSLQLPGGIFNTVFPLTKYSVYPIDLFRHSSNVSSTIRHGDYICSYAGGRNPGFTIKKIKNLVALEKSSR